MSPLRIWCALRGHRKSRLEYESDPVTLSEYEWRICWCGGEASVHPLADPSLPVRKEPSGEVLRKLHADLHP